VSSSDSNGGLPSAGLVASARFVAFGLLPPLVRGLFSPRKSAMKVLTAVNADALAASTLSSLKAKHGGQGVRLLGGRIVTLWGPEAINEVLEKSATEYDSGSGAKGKGMSHFHPDAVTLSSGEEWKDRRAFVEHVLATSDRLHPDAARFCAVVADEVDFLELDGSSLSWEQWEQLWDRITLRVIFGDRARYSQELTALLEKLMGEANRLVGLGVGDDYYEFYGALERELRDPQPGTLLARFAAAPQTDRTRVVHQIPHMMFAMRDTLGANAFRALAVVAADPQVCSRVRASLSDADVTSPESVDGLSYLEGCLQEAMRLWPTVPLLARETRCPVSLAGTDLDEGTQVMILNTFNHRDTDAIPDAGLFHPERWMGEDVQRDPRFLHLSGGSQYCPGVPLVLLLGKAALAGVLARFSLTLTAPDLDASGELPHMLNFYDVKFEAQARD
jgi:cytochrome P450